MSPIGRIFLVLNLILSALFLGWASKVLSESQDYRTRYEQEVSGRTSDLEAHETLVARLNTDLSAAQTSADKLREERDQARVQAERANADLAEEKRTNAELRETLTAQTEQLGDYNARLESLLESRDRAVEEVRTMLQERDQAVTSSTDAERARREFEGQLTTAQTQVADLERELTTVRDQLQRARSGLDHVVEETGFDRDRVMTVPRIDATVVSVRADIGLVALNVGSNRGVERGMTFDVYRGDQYKGAVRVETVDPNQSAAVITRPSPTEPIAQGDNATTQL